MRESRKRALLYCGLLAPALLSVGLVMRYGVDVPFWDQWDSTAPLFGKLERGELTFGDLIAQHNESRLLFPRLIFLGLGLLTEWNIRAELLLTQLVVLGIVLELLWLCSQGREEPWNRALGLTAVASLLWFSPIHYRNFLWGIQLVVYIPVLCLLGSFGIARSRLDPRAKLLACAVLCTLATYSYANGMLTWVLVPPLLLVECGRALRRRPTWLGLWVLLCGANVARYFWDYASPPNHPDFLLALEDKPAALLGFFALLGGPLSVGLSHERLSAALGLAMACLYGVGIAYLVAERRDAKLLRGVLPWLLLGAYTLVSATLITLGRIGFGPGATLHPKYMAFAVPLPVALVYGGSLCFQHARAGPRFVPVRVCTGLVISFVVLALATHVVHISRFPAEQRRREQAKASLLMIEFDVALEHARRLYPTPTRLRLLARDLDERGYLRPSLLGGELGERTSDSQHPSMGRLEALEAENGGWYEASGWAYLPQESRVGDAVVLTVGESRTRIRPIAVAFPDEKRRDLVARLGRRGASRAGWRARFRADEPPPSLRAWVLNAERATLYTLPAAETTSAQ